MSIKGDIKSVALPSEEMPGFIIWAIGKLFWVFFLLVAAAGVYIVIVK